MSSDIISIRGFFEEYKGEQLDEILKYLIEVPQEDESLYIPILRDGDYTIIASTKVVKGYDYSPEIDDLEEIVEEIKIKKKFIVSNKRLYRNDKLAVIISPHYGLGWYTWFLKPELLTHPLLVERVESKLPITKEWIRDTLNVDIMLYDDDEDILDHHSLEVRWVPKGCTFRITEYDGIEYIELFDPSEYIMA